MFKSRQAKTRAGRSRPAKLLAWALGLGLLFGLIEFGEIAENWLRIGRNRVNEHAVSGDIVLVSIDDEALKVAGRWPWPRSKYADLVDKIEQGRPAVQLHDVIFNNRTTPADDRALADAAARAGDIYFAGAARVGAEDGEDADLMPYPELAKASKTGSITVRYNYANQVWDLKPSFRIEGKDVPTFANVMAGANGKRAKPFPLDYSSDPTSVPVVSAGDLLSGRVSADRLRGKTVIVGLTAHKLGDQFQLPGYGKFGGVYVHIIGAETLKAGAPVRLGWIPSYLLAALTVLLAIRLRGPRQVALIGGAYGALLLGPVLLDRMHVYADVTPGVFVLAYVTIGLAWRQLKKRGLVNPVTGLPNLIALKKARQERDRPLIAARVVNYAEISSTLSAGDEKALVEQIVNRLRVGGENTTIYQGDEGIFAWTIEPGTAVGHHVEALHALFRGPARVGSDSYDVAIAFGVEIGSGRSLANRFGSALVAADEAAAEGLKWKYHDPERLRDANWRLSLLSQLDEAIDKGEVWVAFQPQLDLRTNRVRGAEALARWTHPEKGPISPSEFVAAAEQHDRIEKLTFFVLDKSISAAAEINRKWGEFDIAVNLSARMLQDRRLPMRVRALLSKHGLAAERLTLELTETAAMDEGGADIESLLRLRDLGIRISIDDYGTGLSTLDYLKKIPASEIKIDQTFVKSMRDHRSDMVMVQSTIALAHSLGRTVVAEGVEDREVLDLLVSMNCEIAQGFLVGRPTSLQGLLKRLQAKKARDVA